MFFLDKSETHTAFRQDTLILAYHNDWKQGKQICYFEKQQNILPASLQLINNISICYIHTTHTYKQQFAIKRGLCARLFLSAVSFNFLKFVLSSLA